MPKQKTTFVVLSIIAGAWMIGSVALRAEPQEPARIADTGVFMRAKLASSKKVMEGLVTDDFQLIRSGAEEMKSMSQHAEWPRAQDQVYEHFSEDFRRQCIQLSSLATKRNREGVHFTYLSVTTTCVSCHNYVRGAFHVVRVESNKEFPVQLIPDEWEEHSQGSIPSRR